MQVYRDASNLFLCQRLSEGKDVTHNLYRC